MEWIEGNLFTRFADLHNVCVQGVCTSGRLVRDVTHERGESQPVSCTRCGVRNVERIR